MIVMMGDVNGADKRGEEEEEEEEAGEERRGHDGEG